MSSASNTPPEGYFNDLSRPTGNNGRNKRQRSPAGEANGNADAASGGDSNVPKPKRIACIICRKRKLKCDGSKPSCSTCTRLGHSCAYDEVRRKSGPKRGYVKALEERLSKFSLYFPFLVASANAPLSLQNRSRHYSRPKILLSHHRNQHQQASPAVKAMLVGLDFDLFPLQISTSRIPLLVLSVE